MTKIAHLADLHLRKEKADDILIALDSFEYKAREEHVRLIAISGDIWDGAVQNTEGSMFPVFVERIRRLAEIAPVVMIYGTPSHDTAGSLDVFETLDSTFGITVLRPGIGYILANGEICRADEVETGSELLIFGVPEPSKKWLLANAPAAGKETAAEAAAQALQNLFLGLAATREQYSDLPCIVLYHGRVRGAIFSNGQVSDDGVSRDALASVGADYYALGDIHEPQEIRDLPTARYSGSLYPCNWGETHKPGWNLIDIGEFSTGVMRREFPLPQQMKISAESGIVKATQEIELDTELSDIDMAGRKVWLEIQCSRDHRIDTEKYLAKLMDAGAVPGSRVTLNIQATETVRAAEITEKTKLRDKVAIWAEASGETVGNRILDKADDLEEEAKRSGAVSSSAHIRLKKLVLRGAIGIWKGQHKEEIVLDLDNLDQGLIALVGVNGAGKTTLIENLHPWPQMLTRSGKLQDHFMLRDSFRDLYFVDDRTGIEYRALLSIDGKNKSGSIDYHLYRNTGSGFQPVPDINGRREVYIEKIEELFGSLQLYLKSAFISQRPSKSNPDLSDTTKGEKKQLFAELAGVDYLAGYAEIAKEKAKTAEGELVREEARRDTIAELLETLPELEEKLSKGRELTDDIDRDLVREQGELETAESKLKTEEERYRHQSEIKLQIDENGRTMAELSTSLESLQARAKEYQRAATAKTVVEQTIADYEEANSEKASLTAERGKLYEQYQKDSALWNNQTKALRDNEQALHAQETNLEREIARLNSDVAVAETSKQSREEHLRRLEADEKVCPTCGQDLPADAVEKIEEEIQKTKREIEELIEQQKQIAEEINVHQKALEEIQRQIGEIEYPPEIEEPDTSEIDAQIEKIADAIARTNIEDARSTLRKSQEAEVRIQELTTQLREKRDRLVKLSEADKALRADFDVDYREAFEAATAARDERQGKVQELRERRAGYAARIEELEAQIAQLHEKRTELGAMAEKITQLQQTAADWRILEQACGRDGIQALELDALAPNIAEVANRILQAAYGSKFFIEFRTTRMSGAGSRTKQIETFDIFVLDNEDGTEQTLETLSGGESVWIKGAIYEAFGIIRGRNTGLKFLTAIKDEADGALDPAARERYCRMLEKAHDESGQHQTIIITHSREIQEMIQQTIDITALGARSPEEVAA